MQLEQQAHADLYARVSGYLRQAFGELAEANEEFPSWVVRIGRKPVLVSVAAVGDDSALVDLWTWVGHGLVVTPEVAQYLLTQNASCRIGALGVDDEDSIVFEHSLMSEGVNNEVLARVVRWMSSTAEDIEDELNMQFR
jgi:sensor domain CHASE-containing protein